MADTPDLRRYRTGDAAKILHELGAPRSTFTLRKDHLHQTGERGPPFTRDAAGVCWYWHSDLAAWAESERAKLSPNNPPPPAVMRRRAQ